ncbi:MAG: alpha-2-macroglobulin family protein [Phycisphaerales bacterium]
MTTPREDDIFGTIDDYVHDLLPPEERAVVARRIAESGVWAAAHAEALRRRALLLGVPASEPDDRLVEATLRRVAVEGPRRHRRRRAWTIGAITALAASVVLFLGLGQYFRTLAPTPYDLSIMGQRTLAAGSGASLRIRLTDHRDGQGVGRSMVSVSLRDPRTDETVRLAEFETDATGSGSPRFDLPDWGDGEYELRVSARTRSGVETITRSVELQRAWRVILGTDKPVYQPGQMIRMRVFALRSGSGRPVGGEGVTFEVADAKGNLVFRERTVTSEFGIAAADCPLADLLVEGAYTVRARVGATESTQAVEVRRYTLPKFRLEAGIDRAYYAPGEMIRGTVDAAYYFGAPVAGGDVEVRATPAGQAGAVQVLVQSIRLDDTGRGEFLIRVPDSMVGGTSNETDGTLEIALTAIDSAGQRVERRLRAVVSRVPMRITVVPESGRLVRGLENEVFVFVTSPDGRPVDARVSVEGLSQDLQTGELGIGSFVLPATAMQRRAGRSGGDGEVVLAVRAVSGLGESVNQRVTLPVGGRDGAFILRTDAAAYDAGSTARITVFGSGREPVFVDLLRGQQTILTESMPVDGVGTLDLDLPIDLSGACRVVAYRFDRNGRMVRQERTIVVRPAPALRVAIDTGGTSHRPGGTAHLSLAVTDREGRPAPGAVSLAIIDEAVLGVAGGGRLESRFTALDEALLEPIYAVYPWDPFDVRTSVGVSGRGIGALSTDAMPTERDQVLAALIEEGFIDEGFIDRLESSLELTPTGSLEQMFDAETVALLTGDGAGYSLRAETYSGKLREVESQRRAWRRTVQALTTGGIVVGAIVGFVAMVALGLRSRGPGCLVELVVVCVVIVVIIGVLLPSLGKARSAARNAVAMSDMRQFGQAIEMAREDGLLDRSPSAGIGTPARVREWFPETLLWRPQIVTDDQGRATIDVALADSITNWTITGGAITTDGRLGTVSGDLVVFQPFFVDVDAPVVLTRGDVYDMPIVVYNYLDSPQSVALSAPAVPALEFLGGADQALTLEPGEVRRAILRLRAAGVGEVRLEVHARGRDAEGREAADAIRRTIRVVPEGRTIERVSSGVLRAPATLPIGFPDGAVSDSEQVILKIYPSALAQFLEGLEGVFRRPYGCFEQTSSTTYPNLLALDYLRGMDMTAPEIEATALQYIHLGYQRLLTFEVAGGGFDWFGRAPANRTLTAYGLMEFEDMARVRDVDPDLIERTRRWLLRQQNADGSWTPESHALHDDPTKRGDERITTTAYIAWAAFRGDRASSDEARRAAAYLEQTSPDALDDPYTVALVALALRAASGPEAASPYLRRLVALVRRDGERAWWVRSEGARTVFYGAGASGDVEATAMAAIALLESGEAPAEASGALAWLANRRDAYGSWGTTQATVLALKAMVLAAERPGPAALREIAIRVDGEPIDRVVIEPDQAEVVRMLDLTGRAAAARSLRLVDETDARTAYQLVLRHNEVRGDAPAETGPLAIAVSYGSAGARVGEWMRVTASVRSTSRVALPMVVLDLPIPAGFEVDAAAFDAMRSEGRIEKYEVSPRSVVVYLRELRASGDLEIEYRIRATTPVEVTVPGATAAEYYRPEVRGSSPAVRLRAAF